MDIFETLTSKAKAAQKRIVLPESLEDRTMQAADRIIADGIARIQFIGSRDEILTKAKAMGLSNLDKASFFNPAEDKAKAEEYCALLYNLRKSKIRFSNLTNDRRQSHAEQTENHFHAACEHPVFAAGPETPR